MNRSHLFTPAKWVVSTIILLGMAQKLCADIITPTGVAGSSYFVSEVSPVQIINNSGLSSPFDASSTHNHSNPVASVWHTSGIGGGNPVVANQWVEFTLPGAFNLTDMYVWNMNRQSQQPARSVKDYDLLVSSDGITWNTALANDTLTPGTGNNGLAAQQRTFATQNNVRFARINIKTSGNNATNESVGLSEVKFGGTFAASGPTVTHANNVSVASLPKQPSGVDLLQGISATTPATINVGNVSQLTDGIGSNSAAHRVSATSPATATPWSLSYHLNQASDLSEINVFSFDSSSNWFDFDVKYSTDNGATWKYIFMGANNTATGATSNQVALASIVDSAGLGGAIAQGATDLQFDFRPYWTPSLGYSRLIEIDAFGSTAAVPEPSCLAIMLPAAAAFLGMYRRKRTLQG